VSVAVIVFLVIVVLAVLLFVFSYNGVIRLRNRVDSSWSQIGVQLERRHDLIPNLIETVKGYAAHERQTLEEVVQARKPRTCSPARCASCSRSRRTIPTSRRTRTS
jgi:LemA protein